MELAKKEFRTYGNFESLDDVRYGINFSFLVLLKLRHELAFTLVYF